jgi:hypothetical protein
LVEAKRLVEAGRRPSQPWTIKPQLVKTKQLVDQPGAVEQQQQLDEAKWRHGKSKFDQQLVRTPKPRSLRSQQTTESAGGIEPHH